MIKELLFVVIVMTAVAHAWAIEENKEGDSFLSEAISSATKKIDKVTSGDERVFSENAKGVDRDVFDYNDNGFPRSGSRFTYSSGRRKETKQGE